MNKEEMKAIEDMNRFANGIDMSCVNARQMQIILNLIEKLSKENEQLRTEVNSLKKENEEFRNFLEKIIREYIPDYELEQLIDRYKNESFIPRVEVKKILEDRRK